MGEPREYRITEPEVDALRRIMTRLESQARMNADEMLDGAHTIQWVLDRIEPVDPGIPIPDTE